MPESKATTNDQIICYHCGDICRDTSISKEEKYFCCSSCLLVYEILEDNKLCKYYDLQNNPGISPSVRSGEKYSFLNDEQTLKDILDFSDGKHAAVTLNIPQMHCSSCIWLLENLYKLNPGIKNTRVNFLQKKLTINFEQDSTSLKDIANLLDSLGYEPEFKLEAVEKKSLDDRNKKLYYKIGIAGFAFGNIMLLSFPEYLGLNRNLDFGFGNFFGFLNLLLSIPVFFYSASVYYVSAIKGLRKRVINIDVPLSLGILVFFIRTAYEVISHTGAGYADSMTGLVFFLLAGRVFQNKTYDFLNFERSYKSYFPLSVTVIKSGKETTLPLAKIKKGDRIVIRNGELIPADSILFKGEGNIDYSFVTGESIPVGKVLGEIVYAGGRQCGGAIELEVLKEVSQSYLTQLWNNDAFGKKDDSNISHLSNLFGKYFTIFVLSIAFFSAALWFPKSPSTAFNVFTAVLIVACPCALALSIPFTLGNLMRILGRNKFYLKNTSVLEKLSKVTTIVFDKTGTLTQSGQTEIDFEHGELNDYDLSLVKSIARHSTHPLSRKIYSHLSNYETLIVNGYDEVGGKGITGNISGNNVMLGSEVFVSGEEKIYSEVKDYSKVYVSINGTVKGNFKIRNKYRDGIQETTENLGGNYDLHLLSGDNEGDKNILSGMFNSRNIKFRQSPGDKLAYIKELQEKNKNVLMIGDGLNDAGALRQSNIGISISENVSSFSPACDAILEGDVFTQLPLFLKLAKKSITLIIISFLFSLLYNIGGLAIAVRGLLSPIVAAVLMPVSSVSVVLFCVISTNIIARKNRLKTKD